MNFIEAFVTLYIEMAPYLAFGLFVAGILHVVVHKEFILAHFGKRGIGSVIRAAVLGVPLPLCSCSVVPTGLSLKKHGASNGATVSFLISTPQTGVDSIAATWGMLGPVFALFRPIAAFITGILGGVVTEIATSNEPVTDQESESTVREKLSLGQKIRNLFTYGFGDLMDDIGPNLIAGVFISAIITVLVPDSFFTQYIGNSFLEMVIVMIGAVPLYVCATASIPIAAALMMKGMSVGAAFVFLMAGPATNAATITVLYSKLGKKVGTIYLTVICVGALVSGAVLNYGYSALSIDPMAAMNHNHHGEMGQPWWMILGAVLFTVPLAWSLWKTKIKVPLIRLLKKRVSSENAPVTVYRISGMSCSKCAGHVADAAKILDNVANASVDLDRSELTVTGTVDRSVVEDAVVRAGYRFEGAVRGTFVERSFAVSGMSCQNCVRHVTDAVISLPDCFDPVVSLESNSLRLKGMVPDESVIEAVTKAGYGCELQR